MFRRTTFTYVRGGNVQLKDITIGILAWKSPKTLMNTLESFKKHGLLKMIYHDHSIPINFIWRLLSI